MGEQMNKAHS